MIKKIVLILLTLAIGLGGSGIQKSEASSNSFSLPILSQKYPQIVFLKGNPTDKAIALTFDDGPDNNITLKILDVLKEERIKATFFVTGINAGAYPRSLKRIYDEGHCIGNHSWSHANKYDETTLIHEVIETEKIINQITGKGTHFFRPPYGLISESSAVALNNLGFQIIGWNSDSYDWRGGPKDTVITNILRHTEPGTIVLQHCFDNNKLMNTVTALPEVINHLRKDGYTFVTIPELLADSSPIIVKINEKPINFLMANCWPQIKNNVTLTPLRATFEKMGAQTAWDETQKVVIIKKDTKTITLKIGSPVAYINNRQVLLDTPPHIDPQSNQTMVPLRFVSESLNTFIDWRVIEGRMVINIIYNNFAHISLFPKTLLPKTA